ncbi:siphovirus Gp157 family protein [Arcobacter sp. KX21116]|uniref:siphovirus Gp157 family protein n=1 Tax=Arcobacter iocasae TaxID=2906515 RepID=UPI0035D513A5
MKLTNYALQNQIEYLGENKTNSHFKEYIQNILEDTSKPYYQRCDYVGLSLNELKLKIDSLGKDIQELQSLKKKLTSALEIAKELTAEVFINNGIDRIDGTIISSLTISKPTTSTKEFINIKDENKVMGLGFVKFSVDVEAVEKALTTKQGKKELEGLVEVTPITTSTQAKVKVNTKRSSVNNEHTDEILIIEEQVA